MALNHPRLEEILFVIPFSLLGGNCWVQVLISILCPKAVQKVNRVCDEVFDSKTQSLAWTNQKNMDSLLPCSLTWNLKTTSGCRGKWSSTGQISGSMLVCVRVQATPKGHLFSTQLVFTGGICFPYKFHISSPWCVVVGGRLLLLSLL